MIQRNQKVVVVSGGDATRAIKVQTGSGTDDFSRFPLIYTDGVRGRDQEVQLVTGGDTTRIPKVTLDIDAYIRSLGPAAWFRMDQGVTVTGAGISQVDDLSGNARHLLDPGTTRPIYLPYSGTKYLYLPGVANNYASTPDSPANSIAGDIDISVRVAMDDWTPAATQGFCGKDAASNRCFALYMQNTGKLQFFYTSDGTTTSGRLATSSATPAVSDGVSIWVRVTYAAATGKVNFYQAEDSASVPSSWTAIGTEQTITAGAIFDGTSALAVGVANSSGGSPLFGKIYRAIIKNGIDGTTVVDFNPADASDGATSFVSSTTGETWTINRNGSLPAYIVGMAGAMANGSSHYLRAEFTSDQPITDYLVCRPLSWTASDQLIGGVSANAGAIEQSGSTPAVVLYDGSAVASNTNLALNATAVVCAVHNGASSSLRVNNTTATTGDAGAGNPGGITLFANNTPGGYANAIAREAIRFHAAHSTALQARLIAGLMARHGVA